jgi:hypothetical protein
MHQHVPLGNLGSPGLPTPYDPLRSHRRVDKAWPPEPRSGPGPRPRRGLLSRIRRVVRPAVGTS